MVARKKVFESNSIPVCWEAGACFLVAEQEGDVQIGLSSWLTWTPGPEPTWRWPRPRRRPLPAT